MSIQSLEKELSSIAIQMSAICSKQLQVFQNLLLSILYSSSPNDVKQICNDITSTYRYRNHPKRPICKCRSHAQSNSIVNTPLFDTPNSSLVANFLQNYQSIERDANTLQNLYHQLIEKMVFLVLHPIDPLYGDSRKHSTIYFSSLQQRIMKRTLECSSSL